LSSSSLPRSGASSRDQGSQLRVPVDGRQGIHQITWRASLLEQIRSYTTEAYSRRSAGGEEVGGILLGNRLGDALQVTAWRPIMRSSGSDALFVLDAREESLLRRQIGSLRGDAALRGMEVLGWFRSRVRGEARVSDTDLDLHQRMFNKEWQFCMIVRPSNQRPAQANLFLRDAQGLTSLAGNLLLNPGPVEVSDLQGPRFPLPEVQVEKGLDSAELAASTSRPASWGRLAAAAFLAILILAGTFYALRWQSQAASQSASAQLLQLKVRPVPQAIIVSWDSAAAPLRQAKDVKLEINGVVMPLSQSQILLGSARIPLNDPRVKDIPVRLFATAKDGHVTEEFTRLIDSAK
jgi:proteasome lid subunit RPN8/RPN11